MSESLVKVSREFLNMLPQSGEAQIEVLIKVDEHTTMEQIQTDLSSVDNVFLISARDSLGLISVSGMKDPILTLLELNWVKKMFLNQKVDLIW